MISKKCPIREIAVARGSTSPFGGGREQLTFGATVAKIETVRIEGLSGGSVSAAEARRHAETQYDAFRENEKRLRHDEADRLIRDIKDIQKRLPKDRHPLA
jgi:ATP-dependent protease HslVU (ClpYQ) peptidase subunit